MSTDPTSDASNSFLEECGRRVRAARNARHWSMAKLAEKTGLSGSAIGMIEQGRRPVLHEFAQALESVFDLPAAYWMGTITEHEAYVLAAMRSTPEVIAVITGRHERAAMQQAFDRLQRLALEEAEATGD